MCGEFDAHLKTVQSYRLQLRKFKNYLEGSGTSLEEPLTRIDVQQYITTLSHQGYKASSIHLAFNTIRAFARWTRQASAVQNIRIVKPISALQWTPQSLERKERNLLLRRVEQSGSLRNIAIIVLLLYCGLRVGELVALQVRDVELKRGGLVYVHAGKGNRDRIVPTTAEVRTRVQEYLASREPFIAEEPLFLSNRGKRISIRAIEFMVKTLDPDLHPHQLRHTFVRGLLDQGVDLVTVAKLAGHQDLNTTRAYATPTLKNMADAPEGQRHSGCQS
ncbi:recombinase XerC [Alicyclobacillaceae bacterium I2511]|jgi:site-specific recombinase XerD|nr:recombinase XerC [Alicyclobacillaceae bacterium I2511]